MQSMRISDSNGTEFIIEIENGKQVIYKMNGDKKEDLTPKELEFVYEELKKIKASELDNAPKTYDDFLKMLKEMILNGKLKDYNALKDFVNSCNLSQEEKEKLLESGLGELDLQNIIELRTRIINSLEDNKKDTLKAMINFTVLDDNIGTPYCNVKLDYKDDMATYPHINEQIKYNETVKKELINPIVYTVAKRSKINVNFVEKVANTVENRGNFRLGTEEKTSLGVYNVDYEYADSLQKQCTSLKEEMSVNDNEERNKEVTNIENKNNNYQNGFENMIINEKGEVFDLNGNFVGVINEKGEIEKGVDRENNPELNKGTARVRVKNGFTASTIIFAVTSFISGMLILMQIILLTK